jgi:uncharacterized protein (DUF934 family)
MSERVIRLISAASGTREARIDIDDWQVVGLTAGEDLSQLPPGHLIVPLSVWKARRTELIDAEVLDRNERIGVWLQPDEEPGDIAADVEKLPVIAVHFPKWGEGRGYSTGVLLRTRYAFRGELRAFGDIGRDHLFNLARCGFDAFALPPQRDPGDALAAFDEFSLRYQGSVDDPVPLFRKRATVGATR